MSKISYVNLQNLKEQAYEEAVRRASSGLNQSQIEALKSGANQAVHEMVKNLVDHEYIEITFNK